MPRINRRTRTLSQPRRSRAQTIELLIGANGQTVFRDAVHHAEAWDAIRSELSPEFERQWYAAQATPKPFAEIAETYARQVVAGEVPAAKLTKFACQRHLDDLARAAAGEWKYEFDATKAERACRFIELLPHTKGKWASRGELMVLEPWQVFIVCAIFGWVNVLSQTRRFTLAYLEVARKNAKSQLAACIGIYMFAADGEFGAEVYSGATKEKQAYEVFRPAHMMMERSPELAQVLGVSTPTKSLNVLENGSRFEPVVGKPGDGASPHCAIVDEYHEHDTDILFDTFRTGMGAREQPLLLVITTAGSNTAGPCKALQGDVVKVLQGSQDRDEMFGIIYTKDADDDWSSDLALTKANPNLGVSVRLDFLVSERTAALASARKQGVFKTKHLCVWIGANLAFFNLHQWNELADPSLRPEGFLGSACAIAVDLSSRIDFTARVIGFKKTGAAGKEHYYVFSRFYLPEAEAQSEEKQHYQGWAAEGHFTTTMGNIIDMQLVQDETIADCKTYKARELAHDPWNAESLVQAVAAATQAVAVKIPQNAGALSPAMKELEALLADGRVHHDGNPVMAWMMGNVVAHEDANENVFPRKEPGREENKIDGAVAVIMVISRLMVMGGAVKKSVYATRGLLRL
jgi:phage terminase large subunit-like protein